ncbi:DUF4856 domain-containing protein [Fodinibius salsisoli]|uniref:DUF4856 domain-containing protein n=1 Tax=Fodinibius salsisoli TaxID=2820877 RepID=A0ABT3PQP8_9BACT|nr:DUF4856 domain-containing protein [Fodinibius salsisoli]MCW9708178.1 DUF4856 domain-containing protein [Fodinibius salsisoli]
MKIKKGKTTILYGLMAVLTLVLFTACDVSESNDNLIEAPETYEFTRNGSSSVAYPGQTDRLDMVEEIKAYIETANGSSTLSEQALIDMYENTDGDGGGNFSFTSDRQIKNKTFQPDVDNGLFQNIFADAADASENGSLGVPATNGVAGLIDRADGDPILVDANGREFSQIVAKGLMGATFYNQIFNVYLTDDRIGPSVDNVEVEEGKNYTSKEHHFDEAFGYWDPPLDFTSPWNKEDDGRFWSHYSNSVDEHLGTNKVIMDAFIKGRTAIVNDDQEALNAQVDILYENLELVAAAVTIHYINSTLSDLNNGEQGEAFHHISEAWGFLNALKYSPQRKLSVEEVDQLKQFGANGNFWDVTSENLNTVKATLVETYPSLESVQDNL